MLIQKRIINCVNIGKAFLHHPDNKTTIISVIPACSVTSHSLPPRCWLKLQHGGSTFGFPSTNNHPRFLSSLVHFLLQSLTTMSHKSWHYQYNSLHRSLSPPSSLVFFFSHQRLLASLLPWKCTEIKYTPIFF